MSDISLRFWGTRGSIPSPGPQTVRYGGNTTCFEIGCGETVVVIDAGTGIRQLGPALSQRFGQGLHLHLLFTHTHWDHIQGLPFFSPAYDKSNRVDIYGSRDLRRKLEGQMQPDYFPIPFSTMAARISFREAPREFPLGSMQVRTTSLPHPGGCLGYRFETATSKLVIATDCELASLTNDDHLPFFERADAIVIDCQYSDAEYAQKKGWGHNSVSAVVDLCRRVQPGMLLLTHHDPESNDSKIDQLVADAARQLRDPDCQVIGACEQARFQVRQPIGKAVAG
jgi:phosphoribosyl 1,2-cyclic phosphodiesterase